MTDLVAPETPARTSAEYVTEMTADQAVSTERQQIVAEVDARTAEQAISVALATCQRAGWRDFTDALLGMKQEAQKRLRRLVSQ